MSCHSQITLTTPCTNGSVRYGGTALNGFGQYVYHEDVIQLSGTFSDICMTISYWGTHQGQNYHRVFINGVQSGAGWLADVRLISTDCAGVAPPPPPPRACIYSEIISLEACRGGVHTFKILGTALGGDARYYDVEFFYTLTSDASSALAESRNHPFGQFQGEQLYQPFINGIAVTGAGFRCGFNITATSECPPDCSDCCRELLPLLRNIRV